MYNTTLHPKVPTNTTMLTSSQYSTMYLLKLCITVTIKKTEQKNTSSVDHGCNCSLLLNIKPKFRAKGRIEHNKIKQNKICSTAKTGGRGIGGGGGSSLLLYP